jgi:TolB-like protein/Tfp pilus assembly protein PilF
LGFIPTIFFSWAFEITPEGIKKEKDVARDESITNLTAKKLDMVTIGLLVVAIALFGLDRFSPREAPSPNSVIPATAGAQSEDTNKDSRLRGEDGIEKEKSIAVLPFADMSQAGDQEYFADGISEEILNVLVRIPQLKVAGRTSSFSFKGKNEDLRVIGASLGVNHVLEGSVRRSNNKLRITAQLIRSDDGYHLWSETYDREMTDIFDIQDEIAQQVVDQLVISLGLEVKTSEQNRTADLVVYEDYLKAKQLFLQRGRKNLDRALELVNEATTRDPNYAPAWTLKAYIYGVYKSYVSDEERRANSIEWHELGKAAAQRAITLNPKSGEAFAALALFHFYDYDFIPAFENFERALAMSPDNPVVLDIIAQNYLDIGYFEKSKKLAEKAIAIDPLVAMYRNTLGWASIMLGQQAEAVINLEKSIELDPSLPFPYNNMQLQYFNPQDLDKLRELIHRRSANGVPYDLDTEKLSELANNESLLADKNSLRRFALESNDDFVNYIVSIYFQDVELSVKTVEKYQWSAEHRSDLYLFDSTLPRMYSNKRWKEQIRKDGVLALWQAKGFPAHCKAVGEDDFECK